MSRKHPQFTPFEKTTTGRRFYGGVGIAFIFFGISTMGKGRLYYHNYRGDHVFAPFAIVIGIIALTIYFRNRPSRKQGSDQGLRVERRAKRQRETMH